MDRNDYPFSIQKDITMKRAYLKINSEGLPVTCHHSNADIVIIMSFAQFVWIKVFNVFTNINSWKCDQIQVAMSNVIDVCWKFTVITISKHWLEKLSSNSSDFCLKHDIKQWLWNNDGISPIFLSLKNIYQEIS